MAPFDRPHTSSYLCPIVTTTAAAAAAAAAAATATATATATTTTILLLLLLLLQMSWITVLPSHSFGGTLQSLYLKLLHSSTQTSADDLNGHQQVSLFRQSYG